MEPIICPKCAHQQNDDVECQSCGLIFARYQQVLARKTEESLQTKNSSPAPSRLPYIVVIVALIGIAGYFYLSPSQPPQNIVESDTVAQSTPPQNSVQNVSAPSPTKHVPRQKIQKSSLKRATQATVQIQTSWGTGSGFFITESFIVTNKHVIEPHPDQLLPLQKDLADLQKLVRLEREKLTRLKRDYRKISPGPTREQLKIFITRVQQGVNKIQPQVTKLEEQLRKMTEAHNNSDLTIVLIDGTKHSAYISEVSKEHDLALLSTSVIDAPTLPAPQKIRRLQQGEKVYTIGSPRGLSNTVTAGVFSAYRVSTKTNHIFLQVDAPINFGNSGGPLVDEKGNVQGVNTLKRTDSEGIGFAIPIKTVMEEFGASLY